MSIKFFILFSLLIFYSTSFDFQNEELNYDYEQCININKEESVPVTEECMEITPFFISKGEYESECCKLIIYEDPLERFKVFFGEDWKQNYMEFMGFNEEQLEKELERLYKSCPKKIGCTLLTKNFRNLVLYQNSFYSFNGTIIYDCGNGEKTFERSNYRPYDEEEKEFKDKFDCELQNKEKSCLNRAYKLLSDNSQCCWCEEEIIDNDIQVSANSERCYGHSVNEFKNELEKIMNKQKSSSILKLKCYCSNREGKKVNAIVNSATGSIIIE